MKPKIDKDYKSVLDHIDGKYKKKKKVNKPKIDKIIQIISHDETIYGLSESGIIYRKIHSVNLWEDWEMNSPLAVNKKKV